MNIWSRVLDSCPGLLCCVVNLQGKLLYASQGYKAVALRLFGHRCEAGKNYPPNFTELDNALHEVLTVACLGNINGIEISEHERIWEFTAAPLRLDAYNISGVIIRLSSVEAAEIIENKQPAHSESKTETKKQLQPDFLNAISFMAGIVDSRGRFLAVNNLLASRFKTSIIGKSVYDFIDKSIPANHSFKPDFVNLLSKRSGSIECRMFEFKTDNENFFLSGSSVGEDYYHDEEFKYPSPVPKLVPEKELAHMKIHAGPIEWQESRAILLTFEDITISKRSQEQLHRVLSMDNSLGILNRCGLEHLILREMRNAIKNRSALSIVMIDPDNFKKINETLGYVAGDRILKNFSETLKKILSGNVKSLIGRWSGNEFVIVTRCSGPAAGILANEIRDRSIELNEKEKLILNVGVAEFKEEEGMSLHDFIGRAYDAMLADKHARKNQAALTQEAVLGE